MPGAFRSNSENAVKKLLPEGTCKREIARSSAPCKKSGVADNSLSLLPSHISPSSVIDPVRWGSSAPSRLPTDIVRGDRFCIYLLYSQKRSKKNIYDTNTSVFTVSAFRGEVALISCRNVTIRKCEPKQRITRGANENCKTLPYEGCHFHQHFFFCLYSQTDKRGRSMSALSKSN